LGGARSRAISDRTSAKDLPRHGDLGHLERHIVALADDLGVILISFSRRLVSDHRSAAVGSANVRMQLPRF
jgi:hypothetical protein